MNDFILQTIGLTKKYPHTTALDNVNVTIKKGGIYGFIGQNGAGKTTFMRIISGLSTPNSGSMILFGKSDKTEIDMQRKRMGCMIEHPALYPYMTAHDNLEAMRIAQGIPNKEAVEHCLKIVGLENTEKKKVQNFSLGMKQRLGIAIALLGEPEFLLLDEPTNGLDPVNIGEACIEYTDKDFSGKDTNRPGFEKMMNDIRTGKIKRVIVYKLDRISRSILDFANMMEIRPD